MSSRTCCILVEQNDVEEISYLDFRQPSPRIYVYGYICVYVYI